MSTELKEDPARCPWHPDNCPPDVPRYKPEAAQAAAMALHARLGGESQIGQMLGGVEDVVKDIVVSGAGGGAEVEAWSAQCKARCQEVESPDMSLRTHISCPKCRFKFIYRTSNYSLRSSSDVVNYGACANPLCKHKWEEWS
mmetsp:Transcript_4412/g.8871  ORF Transcript_4412/g.8871 Transcript_4412/m.8871 type:complete len:142 (+) Transcript_4412:46-471(+)|eukprot:CAMPEP_0181327012 /NCGR_PEP_ID=MMETSP1101-20121128/21843_1 /TAXON_ID=46948 /ORGANISM="Rhodomonas abbreviata, Strain Caron Lab Isolate" /LENGTH=141 /DNA_ID=CAMNT_0023435581 /DNA_START=46 /DNA_END=471 /DNA_ORIENTATION=+